MSVGTWAPGSNAYTVPPLVASLTITNPGANTIVNDPATAQNIAYLTQKAPKSGIATPSRTLATQACPGVPFTFTVGLYGVFNVSNAAVFGIILGDSGGKFVELTATFPVGAATRLVLQKMTNPTTASALYFSSAFPLGACEVLFFRIVYDGANLSYYLSADIADAHFVKLYETTKLDFLADLSVLGIEIDNVGNVTTAGGGAGDIQLVSTVFHWKVTTP